MPLGSREGPQPPPDRAATAARPTRIAWPLVLSLAVGLVGARADDNVDRSGFYRNGFEDANTSWEVAKRLPGPTVSALRHGQDVHSGAVAEQFVVLSRQPVAKVQFSHELPQSRAFDEVTGSLWVRCDELGLRVGLQLRFPDQIDPRSGKPLVTILYGDSYSAQGEWQQLRCRTSKQAMQERVQRLRNELRSQSAYVPIDARTAIVVRFVVELEVSSGQTKLVLDDLEFGPIVPPAERDSQDAWQQRAPLERQVRATIGDDQLLIDGRPEILIFTPYHNEGVDELARMGFNTAWIPRYDDTALLDSLKAVGMFAMANPLPREFSLEEALQPDIGLVSFTDQTSQVAFWNMGARLSPEHLQIQAELMNKVRLADSRFRRPILMDVKGAERQFHRNADMIGSSKHILHTTSEPLDFLDRLRRKKKLALPDRPMFTLIQTEPADANLLTRAAGQSTPVIEPEQIWMQGYATLAAGYKGIGYWKMTSLSSAGPGSDERRLAISLLNAHIQLLQEWFATAKFLGMVPGQVSSSRTTRGDQARGRFGWTNRIVPGRDSRPDGKDRDSAEIQVAIFKCDQGLLLLPVWYEANAQFQPGPMAADELSFVATIGRENGQAWEVTTTSVTPLSNAIERSGSGSLFRLTNFDQFAAVVLTHEDRPILELKRRVNSLQAQCARDWIDLASSKTRRVSEIHDELSSYAPISHASSMLRNAQHDTAAAEQSFARGDYDGARLKSRHAMLLTRIVQRRHWERAISDAKLTAGVSSPHTICFQTLPDHWRLVEEIGKRSHEDRNLLRSGDFEDADTYRAAQWWQGAGNDPRVQSRAELFGVGAAQGRRSLHLIATALDPSHPPEDITDPPHRFISPAIQVYAGQIVHISGKVQIASEVTGNSDGLVIYESTKGPVGALRWREPARWQPFQLIREIDHSQELTLTIELRGLGDVMIDDLQVIALDPK